MPTSTPLHPRDGLVACKLEPVPGSQESDHCGCEQLLDLSKLIHLPFYVATYAPRKY